MADPLIVTLEFDAATFARLDALRQAHFPDRGYRLPAHLTLFHALPGASLARVGADLADLAAASGPLPLRIARVLDYRPGAGLRVESDALVALRARLAARWGDLLSRQDAAGFRPHVTVQNKVPAAASVYAALAAGFAPFAGTGTGLLLWRYRGGPWQALDRYSFAAGPSVSPGGEESRR